MHSKGLLLTTCILAIILLILAVISASVTHYPTSLNSLPVILLIAGGLLLIMSLIGTLIRQALRKQWFWFSGILVLVAIFVFTLPFDAVFTATLSALIYLLIPDGPQLARSNEGRGRRREQRQPRREDDGEKPSLPFRIGAWICLLCTAWLWGWLGVIEDSWVRYRQVTDNPFLAFAVLVEALGFTFLSLAWLHLASRIQRQRRYGPFLRTGEEKWFKNWGWAVFWGVFLALNVVNYHALFIPTDVPITGTNFVYRNTSIVTGTQVRFINPKEGIVQVLCVGTDGHCLSDRNGPNELRAPGLRLLPDQARTITFPVQGTYTVWSLSTPGMSVTIHVDDFNARCDSCGGP